jgi:hypothetical protein
MTGYDSTKVFFVDLAMLIAVVALPILRVYLDVGDVLTSTVNGELQTAQISTKKTELIKSGSPARPVLRLRRDGAGVLRLAVAGHVNVVAGEDVARAQRSAPVRENVHSASCTSWPALVRALWIIQKGS